MNKQREEFEKYMKNNHPFINLKSDAYLAMWNIWQTSSTPEGYVVVPKEMTDKQLSISYDFDECYTHQERKDVYKAMIEAVEKNDEQL